MRDSHLAPKLDLLNKQVMVEKNLIIFMKTDANAKTAVWRSCYHIAMHLN